MPVRVGNPHVTRKADGPAERGDSKETSIAVALRGTDLMGDIGYHGFVKRSKSVQTALNPDRFVLHENRELENQEMSSEDYEANGIGDEDDDEDEELKEDTEDESGEQL